MPENINLRPMTRPDAAGVAALRGELGYPTTEETVAAGLTRIREAEQLQPAELFVAQASDGNVVGWVHVCIPIDLVATEEAQIWGLVVASSRHGQGIGRSLMTAAEAWARDHGCREMRLRSGAHRTEAHAFYEHLGYQVVKQQMVLSRKIDPE